MDKQQKMILGIVLVALFIFYIGPQLGLFSVADTNCPSDFRFVSYSPLNDAPINFASRIMQSGEGCILKESFIPVYFQNRSAIEANCQNSNGAIITFDGIVISGGYNYTGQNSGGCWSAYANESNQRCTSLGGTVNGGNFNPANCPSDCKIINPSQVYYVDIPFCTMGANQTQTQNCINRLSSSYVKLNNGTCMLGSNAFLPAELSLSCIQNPNSYSNAFNSLSACQSNTPTSTNFFMKEVFKIDTFSVKWWMLIAVIGGLFLIILLKK